MTLDALILGEALMDVVRRAGQPVRRLPGGSPLNVAIGLGRLGHATTLATWFARDDDGAAIAAHCAASHVAVLPGSDQASRTSVAEATIDAAGHASYTFALESGLPPIPGSVRPRVLHTGSIGALTGAGARATQAYATAARTHAFITFDPNCRPSVMGLPASVRPVAERLVAAADLVKASDEDLASLYPGVASEQELVAQARSWVAAGPPVVVITRGAAGALAVTADTCLAVPADTSRGVADTVGAGDSFMAGLIHGVLTRGYTSGSALAAAPDDLAGLLADAAAIAGITVSRPGADPPWLADMAG